MTTGLEKVVRPRTRKGKQVLEKRKPQLIEPTKIALMIKGATANDNITKLMKDIVMIKKPYAVFFNKKNDWKPFENASNIEFMALKNQSPLFMFCSHNKKRPNNLIIGRTFDDQVLDMAEFGVENYKSLAEFKTPKISIGIKPILIFTGEEFEKQYEYMRIKNLLLDFFSGPKTEATRLAGLENVILFVAMGGKINFRHFRVILKKSGTRVPRVELEEIGPRFDLTLRRNQLASEDLFKRSLKQPKQLVPKKVKNIEKDRLGSTFARVHMERQDYSKLSTRKMKGLKKGEGVKEDGEEDEKKSNLKRSDSESNEPRKQNKRVRFSRTEFQQEEMEY